MRHAFSQKLLQRLVVGNHLDCARASHGSAAIASVGHERRTDLAVNGCSQAAPIAP